MNLENTLSAIEVGRHVAMEIRKAPVVLPPGNPWSAFSEDELCQAGRHFAGVGGTEGFRVLSAINLEQQQRKLAV